MTQFSRLLSMSSAPSQLSQYNDWSTYLLFHWMTRWIGGGVERREMERSNVTIEDDYVKTAI